MRAGYSDTRMGIPAKISISKGPEVSRHDCLKASMLLGERGCCKVESPVGGRP